MTGLYNFLIESRVEADDFGRFFYGKSVEK